MEITFEPKLCVGRKEFKINHKGHILALFCLLNIERKLEMNWIKIKKNSWLFSPLDDTFDLGAWGPLVLGSV